MKYKQEITSKEKKEEQDKIEAQNLELKEQEVKIQNELAQKKQAEDKIKQDCLTSRQGFMKQTEETLGICQGDLGCITALMKQPSQQMPTNFIEICIERRQKGLPMFGLP